MFTFLVLFFKKILLLFYLNIDLIFTFLVFQRHVLFLDALHAPGLRHWCRYPGGCGALEQSRTGIDGRCAQSCSLLFTLVHSCSIFFNLVQSCSLLFNLCQSCSILFNLFQSFSSLEPNAFGLFNVHVDWLKSFQLVFLKLWTVLRAKAIGRTMWVGVRSVCFTYVVLHTD